MPSDNNTSAIDLIGRHRSAIQDGAFVIGVILLVGFGAYELSFTGVVEPDKQIDFAETLIVGAIIVILILYLGWRRVRDLEREIKRRVTAERRAHELAHTDPLTGLANRRELEREIKTCLNAPPGAEEVHAVLTLDLNGFKRINDVYGHPEGDTVLFILAERLRTATRQGDLIARVGGDEFTIVARHLAGPEAATNVGMRILNAVESPMQSGAHRHRLGAGIGIALIPRDGPTAEEILRKADIALYRAKSEPNYAIRFFEEEMDRRVHERDSIEREFAAAIGTEALRPWYQPIVDLKSGEVVGFEALARWRHSTLGDLPPERFIPVAENCGLIRELTDWLLTCATRDALGWPRDVVLSFNISPAQLKDCTLGLRILNLLGKNGLSPGQLEIEITESAIVRDINSASTVLSCLRDAGVRIALDDFGTGYSSLYHLRSFKFDAIKIDRSFVGSMASQDESAAIVRALVGLGNGLGLTITAEGIERSDQRNVLLGEGCERGQGFLYGAPLPAEQTVRLFSGLKRPLANKFAAG